MELLSSVGPYALDADIAGLDGLTEFSDEEYLAVPKYFTDEKIYAAPNIEYLGCTWTVALGVQHGQIYKIGPQILTNDSGDAAGAFIGAYAHFVDIMGKPTELDAHRLIWRIPPGNVILEQCERADLHCVQFFLTGGWNFVERVQGQNGPSVPKLLGSWIVGVAHLIVYLYMIPLMIAIPYFNWQYSREHSFSDWLIWGEISPTVKAFAWPYFAMQRAKSREVEGISLLTPQEQRADANILSAIRDVNGAIGADVQGTHLMNATTQFSTSERVQRVVAYAQQSLQLADAADEETLNRLYPELGTRLKRDFAEAQRLRILGLTNRTESDFARSQELSAIWRDWYDTHQKRIEDAFNAVLQ